MNHTPSPEAGDCVLIACRDESPGRIFRNSIPRPEAYKAYRLCGHHRPSPGVDPSEEGIFFEHGLVVAVDDDYVVARPRYIRAAELTVPKEAILGYGPGDPRPSGRGTSITGRRWVNHFDSTHPQFLPYAYADFKSTLFTSVNWSGGTFRRADFKNAEIINSSFERGNFRWANFHKATITNVNLRRADLRQANFNGATLTRVGLAGADLRHADFNGAVLQDCDLRHTNQSGTFWGIGVGVISDQDLPFPGQDEPQSGDWRDCGLYHL